MKYFHRLLMITVLMSITGNAQVKTTSSVRETQYATKIIGGEESTSTYPWMVGLLLPQANRSFCGGSLIHPQWVMTAAHCVIGKTAGNMEVVVGINDLTTVTSTDRVRVAEIIVFPDYDNETLDNDLALLRLEKAVPGGHESTIAIIDNPTLEAVGTTARVLGWGRDENGNTHDKLREVEVPVVSLATANAPSAYDGALTENMLPAGFPEGGKDSCFGDSGGPLSVWSTNQNRWYQIGIVSFGSGCGEPNSYGIYARVSKYRSYIMSYISPGYQHWEEQHAIQGRYSDNDGDGRNNLAEYLGMSDPNKRDSISSPSPLVLKDNGTSFGAIAWKLPKLRPDMDLSAEFSANLTSWENIDPANPFSASNPTTETQSLTLKAPRSLSAEPQGFFRVKSTYGATYRTGVRPFEIQKDITGKITAGDQVAPDLAGHREHRYRYIPGTEAGSQITLFSRSEEFDIRLDVYNAATGTLIGSSTNNSGVGPSGTDESFSFTPVSGTHYEIRVTSVPPNEIGTYSLSGFQDSVFQSHPSLTPGTPISSSLTTGDKTIPNSSDTYRYKDYKFVSSTTGWLKITMVSTALNSFLAVVNAETNKPLSWKDDDGFTGINNSNAHLFFYFVAGQHYYIRCSTAEANQTGAYTLAASNETSNTKSISPGKTETITLPNSIFGKIVNNDALPPEESDRAFATLTGLIVGNSYTIELNSNSFTTPGANLLSPVVGTGYNDRSKSSDFVSFTARVPQYPIMAHHANEPTATGSFTISLTTN